MIVGVLSLLYLAAVFGVCAGVLVFGVWTLWTHRSHL